MIDWVDGDASAPSHFVTSLRAPWGCIAPVMKHAAYSYTAVGLSLLVLHVGILFAPFAEDVASGWLTGVIYLAMSLTDVAAMFADVYEALTHRITWAEVLPLAAPNAAGLAGGGALLISGLLVCEHTPPRRLGAFVALCLFASATPFHPYGSAAPRVLGGGFAWMAVCAVTAASCFAAPRPKIRRRRNGALISFHRRATPPEPTPGLRPAQLLIRS